MMPAPAFNLQIEASKLPDLAKQRLQEMSPKKRKLEQDAFKSGTAIREGKVTRGNLKKIVLWKSARTVPLLKKNTDYKIRKALKTASDIKTPVKDALDALMKLNGIDISIASAILTAIHPDSYTVIDFRALEALGHPRHTVDFYVAYLDCCKKLAKNVPFIPITRSKTSAFQAESFQPPCWIMGRWSSIG
jgi:hypothetical protein